MTKSERTRQFIIEKTAPLFNKKGYEGTSLSDLSRATGLTKGALYGNFSDKEAIAQEAFRYSIAKVREMVKHEVDEVRTCKQQLMAVFDFFARYVFDPPVPGGCPLLNSAIDADDHTLFMRKIVARELMLTVDFLEGLLEKGIALGEFKKDIRSRELAYTFFCSIEGALMFARVERSREPMDIIVQHCNKLVDQISI
jgi:TetR/AcrR family transcriptional regulator, transcriptional repressor for nem operon